MIGIDLVSVERIERLSRRSWYTTFWLHPDELERIRTRPSFGESMAGVIAAKEAVMKATGRGFQQGVAPTDIRLSWSRFGGPSARFDGQHYLVSMTHSDGYAAAVAMEKGNTGDGNVNGTRVDGARVK